MLDTLRFLMLAVLTGLVLAATSPAPVGAAGGGGGGGGGDTSGGMFAKRSTNVIWVDFGYLVVSVIVMGIVQAII